MCLSILDISLLEISEISTSTLAKNGFPELHKFHVEIDF